MRWLRWVIVALAVPILIIPFVVHPELETSTNAPKFQCPDGDCSNRNPSNKNSTIDIVIFQDNNEQQQQQQRKSYGGGVNRHRRDETKMPATSGVFVEEGPSYRATYLFPSSPDPILYRRLSLAWKFPNGTQDAVLVVDPILRNVRSEAHRRLNSSYCPATAQIKIHASSSGGSDWVLETFDQNGQHKQIGGDEFYITYQDQFKRMAVAHVHDLHNGTYTLRFVNVPIRLTNNNNNNNNNKMQPGQPQLKSHYEAVQVQQQVKGRSLTVEMQYTCGMGKIPFPEKLYWHTGGALMVQYQKTKNILRSPPIHPFIPPNSNQNENNNNNNNKHQNKNNHTIDLGSYDRVVVYGDSNLELMYLCNRLRYPNLRFAGKPQRPLNSRQAETKFLKEIEQHLRNEEPQDNNPSKQHLVALVVGSNAWDIVFGVRHGRTFQSHLDGCGIIVDRLRKDFPQVDVYWWLGTALHIHTARTVENWPTLSVLKYISHSRTYGLYQRQRKLMVEKLDVPVMDVMEASYLSAHFQPEGDTRHYTCGFYTRVLSWFYPNKQEPTIGDPKVRQLTAAKKQQQKTG